jgi:TonB family protein
VPAAANTAKPETEKAKTGSPSKRANPVALEVLVSVTGARANNGGARELFSEETQTVLVFPDGAVIRLTAPVALGQLLFLTNKGSSQEVVCQVLHTRSFGATGAYVELQFTEAKGDFWGVVFSDAEKTEAEFSRQEHVEAQQTTEADPAAVVKPHKAADVDQLKQEVEALRKQLFELAGKRGEGEAAKRTEKPAVENPSALAMMAKLIQGFAPRDGTAHAPKPGNDAAHDATSGSSKQETPVAQGHAGEAPLMPAATPTKEPGRAVVGMSLPGGKAQRVTAKDASEDLLPKPELDFSQMPVEMVNGVRSAYRARHAEFRKVMAPALVVLALVLGIVLWTMKPWRYLGGLKTLASVAAKPGKPSAGVNKPDDAHGVAPSVVSATNPNNSGDRSKVGVDTAEAKSTASSASVEAANGSVSKNNEEAKSVTDEPKKSGRRRGKNGKAEELSLAANGNAGTIAVNDAPVLPAKLVKAANPVYPPDAMRSFITGDVRAELVVEADGRIGEIKVLSGPKPLREAAVEALRQYQYAPATQGGKGVASKVTTTVKFWFNP